MLIDPHRFDHLAEPEVLHRIGELLAVAVGRSGQRARLAPQSVAPAGSQPLDHGQLVNDADERRILAHLKLAGVATRQELAAALDLPAATVSRKLVRLRLAGLCVVTGRTRAMRYRLRTEFSAN